MDSGLSAFVTITYSLSHLSRTLTGKFCFCFLLSLDTQANLLIPSKQKNKTFFLCVHLLIKKFKLVLTEIKEPGYSLKASLQIHEILS